MPLQTVLFLTVLTSDLMAMTDFLRDLNVIGQTSCADTTEQAD